MLTSSVGKIVPLETGFTYPVNDTSAPVWSSVSDVINPTSLVKSLRLVGLFNISESPVLEFQSELTLASPVELSISNWSSSIASCTVVEVVLPVGTNETSAAVWSSVPPPEVFKLSIKDCKVTIVVPPVEPGTILLVSVTVVVPPVEDSFSNNICPSACTFNICPVAPDIYFGVKSDPVTSTDPMFVDLTNSDNFNKVFGIFFNTYKRIV